MQTYVEIFNDPDYVAALDSERKLSQAALELWCNHLITIGADLGERVTCFADLGCGIGRFAIPIAKAIVPISGRVLAIDSSPKMLMILNRRIEDMRLNNISSISAQLWDFKSPVPINVSFLSEVLHAISDRTILFQNLLENSAKRAAVVIRIPSHSQLHNITLLKFFPTALQIDIDRTPRIEVLMEELFSAGFKGIHKCFEVAEAQTVKASDFINQLQKKSFSILRMLSSYEYNSGISAAREYVRKTGMVQTNHNMTCLTAWR
jgi:SAM-dependent methyltransferase